jgi:amidophosphoribosyltransferase
MDQCKGAYACVAMLAGFGIIAFRDPNGIRPLGMGVRKVNGPGSDYLFASESVVADGSGFTDWQDVRPGSFQPTTLPARASIHGVVFRR